MDQPLHLPTIMVVHSLATLISTLLSVYMWVRYRPNRVLAFLLLAGLCASLGVGLHGLRGVLPLSLAAGLGLALAITAAGFFWQTVAAFEKRPTAAWKAMVCGALWLCLWFLPVFQASIELRASALASLIGVYSLLTAREVWMAAKSEPLPSRPLAVVANLAQACLWAVAIPVNLFISPAYGANGAYASWAPVLALVNTLLIVLSLISLLILAKERDERRYRLASERDPLTNLANRRTFVASAAKTLSRDGGRAALLLLDIDHFKRINDTNGHAAGDQVLIAFSRAIESRLPKGWMFARIGGEEFACLLPGAGADQGLAIAEDLRSTIASMHGHDAALPPVTVSIGVATATDTSTDLDTLLAEADAALYRAKAEGRNCVRHYAPVEFLQATGHELLAAQPRTASVARARRRG